MSAKCIRIELEWDNGRIETASGEAATKIMEWWHGCEQMAWIHGSEYQGPRLEVKPPAA